MMRKNLRYSFIPRFKYFSGLSFEAKLFRLVMFYANNRKLREIWALRAFTHYKTFQNSWWLILRVHLTKQNIPLRTDLKNLLRIHCDVILVDTVLFVVFSWNSRFGFLGESMSTTSWIFHQSNLSLKVNDHRNCRFFRGKNCIFHLRSIE